MSDDQNLCSICRKPKKLSGSASITQWISLCACEAEGEASQEIIQETLELCSECGKRIGKENRGSFTQFIFRTEYCRCNLSKQKIESELDFYTSPESSPIEIEEEVSEELDLSPDLYPSDRYKLLRLLGEGSVGEVYLCKDELLSKNVTLKILKSIQVEKLLEFQEEAKATSRLNHPSIIKVLDFGVTNLETPYMVLEYFKGQSLDQYLKEKGPLDWLEATAITIEIASALSYSHSIGIFHRDIKPDNILIQFEDGFPVVKVIDFGLAKTRLENQELTSESKKNLIGTPAYMSPENIVGGHYDARSEVYSLGCLLFELLTGEVPFQSENILIALDKHINSPAPKLADVAEVGSNLEEVVAVALSKDPNERFSDMNEMKEALENCYQVSSGSPVPVAKKSEDASSEKTPFALIAFGLIAVLGLICAPLFLGDKILPPAKKDSKLKTSKKQVRKFEDVFHVEDLGKYLKVYPAKTITDKDLKLIRKLKGRTILYKQSINLNLEGYELNGSGFKYLVGLPIRILAIDSKSIESKNLKYLYKLDKVYEFYMKNSENADDVLATVLKLPEINKIEFFNTPLSDSAFEGIRGSKTMKRVLLGNTGIGDEALYHIAQAKELTDVALGSNNGFTRKGIRAILGLPNLRYLDFGYVPSFGGNMLRQVSRCKKLQNIHIGGGGRINPKTILLLNRCKKFRKIGVYDLRPIKDYLPYIVKLDRVNQLIVTDTDLTDADLKYFLKMKNLKDLTINASPHVSNEALKKFRSELPEHIKFSTGYETLEGNIDNINQLLTQ